jgi:hypothetical protein
MAKLRLDERDCRRDRLPRVCMVCGGDADKYLRKKFAWEPPWIYVLVLLGLIGILIAAILLSVLRKTMVVYCPMCSRHQSHWVRKAVWSWGLLAVWLFGLVALIGVGSELKGDSHVGPFVLGGILYTLVLFVVIGLISTRGVRPKEITDYEIVLTGLHDEFVEAAEEDLGLDRPVRHRRRRNEDEEKDRLKHRDPGFEVVEDDDGPRRRRDDEEEDDEPRRRRRYRDDDD